MSEENQGAWRRAQSGGYPQRGPGAEPEIWYKPS